jgi:hypothetical protein
LRLYKVKIEHTNQKTFSFYLIAECNEHFVKNVNEAADIEAGVKKLQQTNDCILPADDVEYVSFKAGLGWGEGRRGATPLCVR